MKVTAEDIRRRREEFPSAEVFAHPECWAEVSETADYAPGTGGMLRYARDYTGDTFIIASEIGLLHPLAKVNPCVRYVPVNPRAVCPNMKRTILGKMLRAVDRMLQVPVTEGPAGPGSRGWACQAPLHELA